MGKLPETLPYVNIWTLSEICLEVLHRQMVIQTSASSVDIYYNIFSTQNKSQRSFRKVSHSRHLEDNQQVQMMLTALNTFHFSDLEQTWWSDSDGFHIILLRHHAGHLLLVRRRTQWKGMLLLAFTKHNKPPQQFFIVSIVSLRTVNIHWYSYFYARPNA